MDQPGLSPQEYSRRLHEQAKAAFTHHAIRERSPGRWLIAQPDEAHPGHWKSCYWTEVITLRGGSLLVQGDIDFVIFSHYGDSTDPEKILRWMGRCDDFGCYVHQKATIGTGRALIDTKESDVLDYQLHKLIEEREKELERGLSDDLEGDERTEALRLAVEDDDRRAAYQDAIDNLQWTGAEETLRGLHETTIGHNGREALFDCEELSGLGTVTTARVYFAYAALQRLCDLLDAEKTTP
jgi:hypothetical protein